MEKLINQPILSVSDFIALVNQTFEYAYPSVEIEGEVSSFKVNQNKYVFFDLKDAEGSVNCFMTVWQLRLPIEDGMKVIVSAVPKLTQWGKFSLTVRSIRPSGEGSIKKSFELLKAKLELEGLFAEDRKRNLPFEPKYVGVISSTQAAGYADFIKIINERWGGVKVDVAHVQVQGEGAADQIIRAIDYFNQQETLPEVLVVVRGGGSADDLSVFNDELLVRAVASSRIPTLVGVGHETDETLVDLAADVRAATPSNAAQILVPDKFEFIRSVKMQTSRILPRIIQLIDTKKTEIRNLINSTYEKIEDLIGDEIDNIKATIRLLVQLDPKTVLKRGYAIMRGEEKIGSQIEIETLRNIIKAEVKNVSKK
jgi:exodeoxyribonuclease VII large subunit